MKTDPQSLLMFLAVAWFIIYWIMGGVFFAIVVASRFIRLKKARFSCLFTLASAGLAYGAATTGLLLAQSRIRSCGRPTDQVGEAILSLFHCAPNAILSTGLLWFILLVLVGSVAILISRAEKKPVVPSAVH